MIWASLPPPDREDTSDLTVNVQHASPSRVMAQANTTAWTVRRLAAARISPSQQRFRGLLRYRSAGVDEHASMLAPIGGGKARQ
jgi:hypothetical protein